MNPDLPSNKCEISHIILRINVSAGSLLGVATHRNTSFPVGKGDFLDLFPLSFEEFLGALDQQALLELIRNKDYCTVLTPKFVLILSESQEKYFLSIHSLYRCCFG